MSVHEPATLLTDYLLAVLAGWLAWRLHRAIPGAIPPARLWWIRALGLTAISAFVGGSYHGFAPNFSSDVTELWWIATLLIISLLSAVMALSLLHELRPTGRRQLWFGLIVVKFAHFAVAAIILQKFAVVIIDYGLVMLAWAVATVCLQRSWSGWMLAAILLSVLAALVQQMHWALSPRFNHNDLYHVIQALALVGFYRAGRRLGPMVAPVNHAGP